MIPPVPPEVFANNPQFKELYTQLVTEVLNPHDGSTRDADRSESAASLEQELRTYRAELARIEIVKNSLLKLTGLSNGFTDELNDIIDLVAAHCIKPTPLSQANTSLLNEELDDFNDAIPLIAHALSHHLMRLANSLAAIAFPTDPPPATATLKQQRIELLPAHVAHKCSMLVKQQLDLEAKRISLAALAAELGEEYKKILEKTVKLLEEVKFGVAEKAARVKARCLEEVVEGMEGKLKVMELEALAAIYNPESLNALKNYHHHLVDTKSRLQARQRTVEEELKRYDRAGSDMRALVARYSAAMRGIENTTKEIAKLGGNI